MCSCNKEYLVSFPDGHTETAKTAWAARTAAAKVPGATWKPVPKAK